MNPTVETVIVIALIKTVDAVRNRAHICFDRPDITAFAVRHHDKGWNIAAVLKKTMEFQSSLGLAVLGPGIHGQTQIHNRGVNDLKRILEFKFVLG